MKSEKKNCLYSYNCTKIIPLLLCGMLYNISSAVSGPYPPALNCIVPPVVAPVCLAAAGAINLGVTASDLGGVNPNFFRPGYSGPDRSLNSNINAVNLFTATTTMSASEIETLINDAPPNSTICLESGTYRLDDTIHITRSDVTVEGVADGSTIIDQSTLKSAKKAAFRVSPAGGRHDQNAAYNINSGEFKSRTDTSSQANRGDMSVRLSNTSGIQSGDFLFFDQRIPGGINLTKNAMVEVDSVSGNTVNLKQQLSVRYPAGNETSRAVYVMGRDTHVLSNVDIRLMSFDSMDTRITPDRHANNAPEFLLTGFGVHTIVLDRTHESSVSQVAFKNSPSKDILVSRSAEIFVANTIHDGALNTDGGGVGYDVEVSDVTNFSAKNIVQPPATTNPSRHGFSTNIGGSVTDSIVSVGGTAVIAGQTYSGTGLNHDFHGGHAEGNIVYMTGVDMEVYSDFAWSIFDNRGDVFGGRSANNPDKSPYNKNRVIMGNVKVSERGYDERIYMAPTGGTVISSRGDDEIYLSSGTDNITTGGGSDRILIANRAIGNDIVTDFQSGSDRVVIDPSTGITNFGALTVAGDTINLGGGNSLRLTGMSGRINAGIFDFRAVPGT